MLAVEMKNITKRFPGVLANDSVSLEVKRGEIHALLGENGAGKSTLMNILYGLYEPDEGDILINGEKTRIKDPNVAIRKGIGMVHQHFMLVKPFTVTENIVLGAERERYGILDMTAARNDVIEISERYGLAVDPDAKVEDISVGMQQRVEILKALYRGADILILDEPTAVLTPGEVHDLIVIMRKLVKQGVSIIFITHKLKEVMSACDRVTVIRRGRVIGTVDTTDASTDQLAEMMVGRKVLLRVEKEESNPGAVCLSVNGLYAKDGRDLPALNGVSFDIRYGEIVGIAGVDGNGQSELIEVITGLRKASSGSVILEDDNVLNLTIRKRFENGIAHIPEDRHKHGLVLDFSIAENMILQNFYEEPFAKRGMLNEDAIDAHAERLISKYDVRTPDKETLAKKLSGGNQQKVIIARELEREPRFVLAAQPTRGLDVGAIEFVHHRLVEQRNDGKAVLLVSLELDEILSLSDRILVMYEGKIVGELSGRDATEQEIGLLMAGGAGTEEVQVDG